MFTGLVQHVGSVIAIDPQPFGAALSVDSHSWTHRPAVGESIAVNGCCLTVANGSHASRLRFDVIHQTLRATMLGELQAGNLVNLEHAVTPQTMLGGHVVQGHIDGIGIVQSITRSGGEHRVRIAPNDALLMQTIVEKGSIAVSGVSLTIAAISESWFEIALIPTTLECTNLAGLQLGTCVNLETDYIAKVVVNWLRRSEGGSRPG